MASRSQQRRTADAPRRARTTSAFSAASCRPGGGELPSVAAIAVAASLAKGTVYLYLRTKGEIFASILQDGWGEVIGELDRTYRLGHGARADKVAAFLSSYVGYVERHPELLQLDPLGHGVLERNLEAEALLAFKRTLLDRLTAGATILEGALGLPPGRGLQLLTPTYGMTQGCGSRSTICSIPQAPLNPFSRSFATNDWTLCQSTGEARWLDIDAMSERWSRITPIAKSKLSVNTRP